MQNKQELKIQANFFMLNIAKHIKESDPVIEKVRELVRQYKFKGEMIKDKVYKELVRQGVILGSRAQHNLIVTSGRTVLARLLSGDATFSGEIDYGAVGDGNTAFTNASTQLNNELFRKQASAQSFSANVAFIDWFIASGDTADDTFEEFGSFIDGSGAADSGQAFSLLITGGWVKSGSIFISAQYTIS